MIETMTIREIIDMRLRDTPKHTFQNIDGTLYRQRGCHNGPCACTGYCNQMVPATELDVFENVQYGEKEKFLARTMLIKTLSAIVEINK